MSTETVSIGCRLPNGLLLEVGYSVNAPGGGNGGAPFARYVRHADYAQFNLRGTNQHLLLREPGTRKILTTLASQRDREPFINHGVPKDLWERWSREHAKSWHLTSGQVFVVPKPNDTAAVVKDAKAKAPAIFEPLDPSQPLQLGEHSVVKRPNEYLD